MSKPISKTGWTRVAFDDVVQLSRERSNDPEGDGFERYVGLEHLEPGDLKIRSWGSVADGTTFTNVFRAGQVLFGKRRAYQRKVALADFDGVCSGDIYVLQPKNDCLIPELLPFICQTDRFLEHAVGTSAGSLSPRTNWENLASYEFNLPPREEQLRFAEAFACLDAYSEHLRTLLLRGSSLVASRLEQVWSMCPSREIQTLVDEGVLEPPQDGNHGEKHPKASDYVESGIPFVMASDLRDGVVDFDHCKKIPKPVADGLRIGFARNGDVLLSHKGTLGEVARLQNPCDEMVMLTPQVTYYRVRDQLALHPDWLFFSFKSAGFQRALAQNGKQSTRAYVGITAQQKLRIPYCSFDEQVDLLRPLWSIENVLISVKQRAKETELLRTTFLENAVSGS